MTTGEDSGPVAPHAMQLTAWDLPSAVAAGERFKFSVGVRCSAGCNLGGREFSLIDAQGQVVDTPKLGREVWPGTEALYVAEVNAVAPRETGRHQWQATMAGWHAETPHAAGDISLSVCVVGAPECEVTIKAIDREQQTPVRNALVVMHPYRAVTDDNGIAKVRASRGRYDILVSGFRYLAASTSVEVADDLVTVAALDADHPWTSAEGDLA
jgi:hypothetical protein